ncbi:hypothetical protein ABHW69_20940 [Alicyclobacillus fastidiosus]
MVWTTTRESFRPSKFAQKFDQFMVDRGVSGIFILRLIPLVSFNPLNYASGLTTLTFWQFTGLPVSESCRRHYSLRFSIVVRSGRDTLSLA